MRVRVRARARAEAGETDRRCERGERGDEDKDEAWATMDKRYYHLLYVPPKLHSVGRSVEI